jgi:hypothetical protein
VEVTGTQDLTGYDVRARLEDLLERDLLGPWDGPTEELPPGTTPGGRYLLGRLVPRRPDTVEPTLAPESEDDDVEDRPELVDDPTLELDDDGDAESPSSAAIRTRAMAASSLGLACSVPTDVDAIVVTASWGRYERGTSETHTTDTGKPRTVWKRVPAGGQVEVPTFADDRGELIPDAEQDGVRLRWRVRHRGDRRLVELFLINAQPIPPDLPDRARLYQASLELTYLDGSAAIFLGHNDPALPDSTRHLDAEQRLLALQHREQREYAVGRLCAVDADVQPDQTRAWRLRTTCFPAADVRMVVAGDPKDTPGLVLDMGRLGSPDLQPDDLVRALRPLVDGYRRWLTGQETRIDNDPEIARCADVARPALDRAGAVADRLDRAIDLLAADPQAREAFRFANQAMARQRVRSEIVRRRIAEPTAELRTLQAELDVPKNRSWRPFQLAFVLLCLPGLTAPEHQDSRRGALMNGEVELLFFPTGGGKTEAYLGLTAYTIAIRRLQGTIGSGTEARNGADGIAVFMRYTLRLLTAQQFQRATALICACELLRGERIASGDLRWGETPIRIGLWVGSKVTPNAFDDALSQMEEAAGRSAEGQVGGIQQFANCPWCGTALDLGRDGQIDRLRRRMLLFCGDPDGRCAFSRALSTEGIPALVVDEEIYRLAPALLIGTVDKFAALPWNAATAHLFGHVTTFCERHGYRPPDAPAWCRDGGHPRAQSLPTTAPVEVLRLRPPDLIIQDELHLISDALGSMVGLYEAMIDRLCTRTDSGVPVRPVFVASTATVRRAREQVRQVFARGLTVFPPPLFDAGDTFFSRRVDPSPETPSRRYRGILASGERLTAIEIRVMTAVLEYAQYLFDQHGAVADPYMTAVDYFTSTRELAGMRRLVEDDISDRLGRQGAFARRRRPSVTELTSRMDSRKITQSLSDLERHFTTENDSGAALDRLRQMSKEDRDQYTPPARPVDVLLATSMLQVGVDVQRLGLMIVTGQPKNMAEYIQASSRVGRSVPGPGLVLTIYQWNRPRDLAHYEHFGYEHATFGRKVEGLTTTPFSKRALDRGLTGVIVGLLRQSTERALPNLGAQIATVTEQGNASLLEALRERAELVADDAGTGAAVVEACLERLDRWMHKRATLPTGQLGYQAGGPAAAGLLRSPDELPWKLWSTPRSLRDVEPEILLQLRRDDPTWDSAPAWDFGPRDERSQA